MGTVGLCQRAESDWIFDWGFDLGAVVGVRKIVSQEEVWSWKHPDFWEWLKLGWE